MFARLVDVAVGCIALGVFMLVLHVPLSGWVVVAPLVLLIEMLFVAALGLLLAAANVGWRDVSRGLPLVLFLLLYAVPVLYAADSVPAAIRPIYSANPMAHLIEAFRASVLGTHPPDLVSLGVLLVLGVIVLVAAQRLFSVFDGVLADVV
jgi:ABC-type polysaccharide/polyol phosphate export permease